MDDLNLSNNALVGMVGWFILPNLVTGWIQTALYAIFIRAGDAKPAPGSPRYVRDRRRIHICVIVAYLLYSVYDADYQLRRTGDFYQDLGVRHDVDKRQVASAFRKLSSKYHPDKNSDPRSAAIYLRVNTAKDTLVDPVKRFAYDRFGPEVLTWQNTKTIQDYVFHGLRTYGGWYIGTAIVLPILSYFNYMQGSTFWRFCVMAALFAIEAHAMTRPYFPGWLTRVVNPILVTTRLRSPYLPFQVLGLLRKLVFTIFIAISQLAPLLKDPRAMVQSGDAIPPQVLDRLDLTTKATDQELDRMLALELAPFASEDREMKVLRTGLKSWLVQNTIRNDPELRAAMNRAFERRRQEGS